MAWQSRLVVPGGDAPASPVPAARLGRLASQNDPILGRKAKGVPRALTAAEKAWMRAAIVLVAGQVGAVNAGVSAARKTMADLPSL